jgi:uncharacterized OB-fold protein
MTGEVYTETVIHSAPEAFVSEVPYQIVIVTLEDGRRVTGRMLGDRVSIGDMVTLAEERNGVPFFKR